MKKFIIFIVILLAAFAVWYFYLRIDKKKALKIIASAKAGRSESQFSSFDEGFLIAWARAIKRGSPDFSYNGKNYDTSSGTSK